jgi:hypothetical protein
MHNAEIHRRIRNTKLNKTFMSRFDFPLLLNACRTHSTEQRFRNWQKNLRPVDKERLRCRNRQWTTDFDYNNTTSLDYSNLSNSIRTEENLFR